MTKMNLETDGVVKATATGHRYLLSIRTLEAVVVRLLQRWVVPRKKRP